MVYIPLYSYKLINFVKCLNSLMHFICTFCVAVCVNFCYNPSLYKVNVYVCKILGYLLNSLADL